MSVTWWRQQQSFRTGSLPVAENKGVWIYIALGLVKSSNTVGSSIPRAKSLINWQCTLGGKREHNIKESLTWVKIDNLIIINLYYYQYF